MAGPYRSEVEALRGEVETLRAALACAEEDEAALRAQHDAMVARLEALEEARFSEAEQGEAARRVGARMALWGLLGGLLLAGSLASTVTLWPDPARVRAVVGPEAWFEAIRPRCNAVEVERWTARQPPPRGARGQAFLATCYALAGRTELAREVLDALPTDARRSAAGVVFGVAHPIADGGDEPSAGPVMELVLRYTPDNYMALYHAGMSAYLTGDRARAERRLDRFLAVYPTHDGWRVEAERIRAAIDDGERVELGARQPFDARAPWP